MRTCEICTQWRAALLFSAFCVTILVARTSRATPNFPPGIQQDLSLDYQPDCSICHTDGDQGGLGTVNTPFGRNMRERGLIAFDTGALTAALNQMESAHVDSAGDCLDDIDEIKAGRDPNDPDPPGVCGDAGVLPVTEAPQSEILSYGCSAAITSRPAPSENGRFIIVLASLVVVRMRRRAARPPAKFQTRPMSRKSGSSVFDISPSPTK